MILAESSIYPAKHLYRMRADAFIPFQARYLRGAYVVFLYQSVLSQALFPHRLPQIVVFHHNIQAPSVLEY